MTISIGTHVFKTKKEAADSCRRILYAQPIGSIVTAREDHDFLIELLLRHPDPDGKIGVGVLRFEIRENPLFPTRRLLSLIRVDGTETDFSFLKCLTQPTVRSMVLSTLRREISDQTACVARVAFATGESVRCALTGVILDTMADAHVDHYDPTFLPLATQFVEGVGGWEMISLRRADGMVGELLADPDQRQQWRGYHAQHAHLRVVSIIANLSLLTRGVRRNVTD